MCEKITYDAIIFNENDCVRKHRDDRRYPKNFDILFVKIKNLKIIPHKKQNLTNKAEQERKLRQPDNIHK